MIPAAGAGTAARAVTNTPRRHFSPGGRGVGVGAARAGVSSEWAAGRHGRLPLHPTPRSWPAAADRHGRPPRRCDVSSRRVCRVSPPPPPRRCGAVPPRRVHRRAEALTQGPAAAGCIKAERRRADGTGCADGRRGEENAFSLAGGTAATRAGGGRRRSQAPSLPGGPSRAAP